MARLQNSFEVHGDLDEVFTYVTTPTHRPIYLPSVASVRHAAPAPVEAGGGWEERAAFGPLKKWLKVRAVEVRRPTFFAYEPDGGPGDGRVTWTLSAPAEGRVRVEVALEVKLPWGLRAFDRLVPMFLAPLFESDVSHLHQTLATRTADARAA